MKIFSNGLNTALAMVLITPFPVFSQGADGYPNKPVRVVSALATGGAVDTLGRMVAAKLSEKFSVQFFVENRLGAGGTIGYNFTAKAAPDGYTLLVGGSGYTIASVLYPIQYDPLKDIVPIGQVSRSFYLLVSHPSLPVKSARDLVALAKAKPGAINYGSGGVGSSVQFAMELFNLSAGGIRLNHIAYKGSGQAQVDLMAGEIQVMMTNAISSLPHVKTGRLRALGLSSAQRLEALPEIPTIAESGVPGFDLAVWIGFFAPGGTPREILKKLGSEIATAIQDPAIVKRVRDSGGEKVESLDEFHKTIRKELEDNRKIATLAKITAQ